ncbi:MAG TPA: hypothetical protein VGS07_08930 [Thermoanaerobaculia bacterium]|jgi:hypothetical protein|nr:hypothetical protein [Thermoanaerobaculia bacterium]
MIAMDFDTLTRLNFCDMRLLGFRWEEDVCNLMLFIELAEGQRLQLRCTWATDVTIVMRTGDTLGPSLSWDGSISRDNKGVCRVDFDFPGVGEVSLNCNEVIALSES